ncbi:MAG TPA: thiamine phosphate synthase [Gemmatimonadales bacterium]
MRPLPRLFAVTTDALCRAADFGVRAAAFAASGPSAGIVVRAPGSTAAQQAVFCGRVLALARPPEAAVFAHGRPDLACALGAHGVQLRAGDLAPGDARKVFPGGWIGRSVHSGDEARASVDEGADYLVAGNIFDTPSHPEHPGRGLAWLADICRLGVPVIAIGGVTPERAAAIREAGAWGAAAISAIWDAPDPAATATALLAPWAEEV